MLRVLAFTVKPRESADSRYRILQYGPIAEQDGVRIEHRSLIGPRYFQWQIRNVQLLMRLLLYPVLLLIRLWQVLFVAPQFDAVWISREMAPLGPPIFEKLLVWRCKRVILDVDDALHVFDKESSRLLPRLLRDRGKFSRMAAAYAAVVCGNAYLADFYREHGANALIIPTVVDAEPYGRVTHIPAETVRIGWIGTPLNKHHLELLRPALSALAQERRFELVVVGLNEPLDWDLPGIRCIKWELAHEFDYFGHFDIGVMPLKDSPFAQGKCAFKLIQYMAASVPVIASPIGANCEVVEHGWNGYLADTDDEWHSTLRLLIDDIELRRRMGRHGRELVARSYSVRAMWPHYAPILAGALREEPICTV
jgi:glycosyltransferase involved in cell wall biosynthesis